MRGKLIKRSQGGGQEVDHKKLISIDISKQGVSIDSTICICNLVFVAVFAPLVTAVVIAAID